MNEGNEIIIDLEELGSTLGQFLGTLPEWVLVLLVIWLIIKLSR